MIESLKILTLAWSECNWSCGGHWGLLLVPEIWRCLQVFQQLFFSLKFCGCTHRVTFHVRFYGYCIKKYRESKKEAGCGLKIADDLGQHFKKSTLIEFPYISLGNSAPIFDEFSLCFVLYFNLPFQPTFITKMAEYNPRR